MNRYTITLAIKTATVVFLQASLLIWYFGLEFDGKFAQAFEVPEPANLAEAYYIGDIELYVPERSLPPKLIYVSDEQVSFSKKDFDCLARNIFYEAGVESRAGKLAVAQVTHNRLKSGRWGSTVCSVVYAKRQFSWTRDSNKRHVKPSGPLWQASLQAVDDYVAGHRIFRLDHSLHYHADYVSPKWANSDHQIKQIGQHIFYDLSRPVNVAELQQQ